MEATDILLIISYILLFGSRIIKIVGINKAKIVEKSSIPMMIIMFLENFILISYCYLRNYFGLLIQYIVLSVVELVMLLMVIYYSYFYHSSRVSNHN